MIKRKKETENSLCLNTEQKLKGLANNPQGQMLSNTEISRGAFPFRTNGRFPGCFLMQR